MDYRGVGQWRLPLLWPRLDGWQRAIAQEPGTQPQEKPYGKTLLDSIKSQYLQLAELECQALVDEARYTTK